MSALVVGIAGGTGSGKTTVATKIAAALPEGSVCRIEHDSYYRDLTHLPQSERTRINFDHPDALETELLIEHVRALKAGRAAEIPDYDFTTHARAETVRRVEPTPLVIVEGILAFVDPRLRDLMDIKIFVDTDADIRIMRRIRRDMEKRGRTFASIRDQYYATVRPMHLEYVEPSKRWADLIIPEGGDNTVGIDLIVAKLAWVVSENTVLTSGEGPPVVD